MEKPALFLNKREFGYFALVMLLFFALHLGYRYYTYQSFVKKPFYYTYATLIASYEKRKYGKSYQLLKLKSQEGFSFYTTTHRKESLAHKRLRLQLFPSAKISFKSYLGTFYVKSKIKDQEPLSRGLKEKLVSAVAAQHQESDMASFYNAIFFATPLPKDLRDQIAALGVSHLVALSGFHLGILWGVVYGVLLLLYRPLQQRFFPYRYALFDVGMVAMVLLGVYVWFVDAPPSLLRAYAMVFVGWAVMLMGLELLSFTFLAAVVLVLLALFPQLVVSLSFWFSVAGVFYIFLLLHYTKEWNKWLVSLWIIPVGIFLLMLPVVHGIFAVTSSYQFLSPLLSLLFVPFYPLSIVAHLFGYGDILDANLQWLFALPQETHQELLPPWIVAFYIALSLAAIYSKKVLGLLLAISILYAGYLFG